MSGFAINRAFNVGTLAIIRDKTRVMEGGVIKGWTVVQRRRVRVGAVFSAIEGTEIEVIISKASLGLLSVVILLVSSLVGRMVSQEDRISEGF